MCAQPKVSIGLIVFAIFIGLIFFIYIESKWSNYKKKKLRKETVPIIGNTISANTHYKLILSDGRFFDDIKIVGIVEGDGNEFSIGGWEGMVVLQKPDGKKVYVKRTAIRLVEEI